MQAHYCTASEERCYMGKAKSLARLYNDGGETVLLTWISAQLVDLIEFFNVKKPSEAQIGQLATMIYHQAHYFKVTELMMFFYRFKLGFFGAFYGVFEPQRVIIALREFKAVRAQKIDKYERESKKVIAESKNTITREEFIKRITAEMTANNCQNLEIEEYLPLRWLFKM